MHILMLILGAIGAVAAIIWRIRMMGEAARTVADVAETAANLPRKMRVQSKARKGGLETVEDPREAATVLMVLFAREAGELSSDVKAAIQAQLEERLELEAPDAEEVLARAVWLTQDLPNADAAVDRMTGVIRAAVSDKEVLELDDMLRAVAAFGGGETPQQDALRARYRRRAGL